MTREEAKREIEKVFEPAFANYIIKALTDGATESDVEPQEWISVKDRLPTESDEYYVSIRYECENKTTFDNVTTCYFWAKEKMWKGSERMIGKILAWQPITDPSPYKGE